MKSLSMFRSQQRSEMIPTGLSRGLGWYSLALGAAQLVMPKKLARLIGVEPAGLTPIIVRAMGVRELIAGVSVLAQPRRPMPLWTRVAGDLVDLGLLGLAAGTKRTSGARVATAIGMVAGVMALDVIAARRVQKSFEEANLPVIFSVTINKPPEEVYAFYRRLEQLPSFMDYLESVRVIDQTKSHWVAKLPVGNIEWDAEIIEDIPGELIAWRTMPGSKLKLSGRVTFRRTPGRNMTEVRCEMKLGFTGAAPSTALAKAFAKPQIKGDLRRLKQVLETGEVLISDASAHKGPHPAQPDDHIEKRPMIFVPNEPTAEKGVTR
ncbi:MAG: SRPBCC family protein [Deltaproteobacteria bacterium]|nr:SRPBCC family protein [Deltaproteobacteria bacterium]